MDYGHMFDIHYYAGPTRDELARARRARVGMVVYPRGRHWTFSRKFDPASVAQQ